MGNSFVESMIFQVKPDKIEEFENLVNTIKPEQLSQAGCVGIKYMKRFYTFDKVAESQPPRELTKIVKCVKYYSFWEFDTIENCGTANGWFFDTHAKDVSKLLIMPFDINSGYTL